MEEHIPSFAEIWSIFKRRFLSFALPVLLISLLTLTIAMILPAVYKSSATILIEEQEIPREFVMATVTSYAEQRIQSINQRIMSTAKLIEIINRFDLYADKKGNWTIEEIVSQMREDIHLEPISVQTVDRRTGRPTSATIAFTLSYQGGDPRSVMRVTDMLSSLFLKENLKVRENQTLETSLFIEDEMNKVKADLDQIEARLSDFKEKHMNALPEMLKINLQTIGNLEQNSERLQNQIQTLKERQIYLQTQLATLPTQTEDQNRLETLKAQLVHLKTKFSDIHPDVVKLRAEISQVEKALADESSARLNGSAAQPSNPAYITLSSQLAGIDLDIKTFQKQLKDIAVQKKVYQDRIEETPKVEEAYNALIIDRKNTMAKYEDLMRKHMEAKVAHGLEKEQKGERFTLIDPANFPQKPFKPNRKAIIIIGLILAVCMGIAFSAIKEFTDQSVRNPDRLTEEFNLPVLAVIPPIASVKDKQKRLIKHVAILLGIILLVSALLVAFHLLVMDLTILWIKLIRRLNM